MLNEHRNKHLKPLQSQISKNIEDLKKAGKRIISINIVKDGDIFVGMIWVE